MHRMASPSSLTVFFSEPIYSKPSIEYSISVVINVKMLFFSNLKDENFEDAEHHLLLKTINI